MASLSEQLSSHKDATNKNLERFKSNYKSNLEWNLIQVSKSWNSIISIDLGFEKYTYIFSDFSFGSSSLSIYDIDSNDNKVKIQNGLFNKSFDLDFLNCDQLSELNGYLIQFIEHSVVHFLNDDVQVLLEYLIYKYNISINFGDLLISSYIQYHQTVYYCKLLSLVCIDDRSKLYSLYSRIKNVSNNFKEHTFINRNVVLSEILKTFIVYKDISSLYYRMATQYNGNSNILSFLNMINTHYVIENGKTMDNDHIRYIVRIITHGLNHVNDIEYISSKMCLMISLFSHVQVKPGVQKQIINSCKGILYHLKEANTLSPEHLLLFKNFITVLVVILDMQTVNIVKLDEDITKILFDVLFKILQSYGNFKNFNINNNNPARLINLLFVSLIGVYKNKYYNYINRTVGHINEYEFQMDRMNKFIEYVNESYEYTSIRIIILYIIDEMNLLANELNTHGDSIISFIDNRIDVSINITLKNRRMMVLFYKVLKIIKKINPGRLEATISEYLNIITQDDIENHLDVILFLFHAISDDLELRLLFLHNKYYNLEFNKMNCKMLNVNDMMMTLSLFYNNPGDILNNKKVFNSLVDYIISTSYGNDVNVSEYNLLVYNFIEKVLEDPNLSVNLYNNHSFWKSVPINISINALVLRIRMIIESIDSKFKFNIPIDEFKADHFIGNDCEGEKFIFKHYIEHLDSNYEEVHKICAPIRTLLLLKKLSTKNYTDYIDSTIRPIFEFVNFVYLSNSKKAEHIDILGNSDGVSEQNNDDGNKFIENNMLMIQMMTYRLNILKRSENDNELCIDETLFSEDIELNNNHGIFNLFSTLYYQLLSAIYIVNDGPKSELVHSQMCTMMELFFKLVKRNYLSEDQERYLLYFYVYFFIKFEKILIYKESMFNRIFVLERINVILNNPIINLAFNKFINGFIIVDFNENKIDINNDSSIRFNMNMLINYTTKIYDLISLSRLSRFNEVIRVKHYKNNGGVEYILQLPMIYKYEFVNFEYQKLFSESLMSRFLSKNYNFMETELYNEDNLWIDIFDEISSELYENSFEILRIIYSMQNKYLSNNDCIIIDQFVNCMPFLYDKSFMLSKKASYLLIEIIKYSNKFINKFANDCYASESISYEDIVSKFIENWILEDHIRAKEFVNKAIRNYNVVMNNDCILKLSEIININIEFLMLVIVYTCCLCNVLIDNISSGENSSKTIKNVNNFLNIFRLLTILTMTDDNHNDQYTQFKTKLISNVLRLCILMKNCINEFKVEATNANHETIKMCMNETKMIKNYINNIIHDMFIMSIYNMSSGCIWNADCKTSNEIVRSFSSLYNELDPESRNTMIGWCLSLKGADFNTVICLLVQSIENPLHEDIIYYIINQTDLLKNYDLLIYLINITVLNRINKLVIFIKIITNAIISTNIEYKNVQTFLNKYINNIVVIYSIYICNIENIELEFVYDNKNVKNEIHRIINRYFDKNECPKYDKILRIFDCDKSNNKIEYNLDINDNDLIIKKEDINIICVLISNLFNGLLDKIISLDDENIDKISKFYNKIYQLAFEFIRNTILKYDTEFIGFMRVLINNLMVSSIKIESIKANFNKDECLMNSVSRTINNILDLDKIKLRNIIEYLALYFDINYLDNSLYVQWTSHTLYIYLITNDEKIELNHQTIDFQYNCIKEAEKIIEKSNIPVVILSSMVWINIFNRFDPINANMIELNRLNGFSLNKSKRRNENNFNIDDDSPNRLYMLVFRYILNKNDWKIQVHSSLFNDKKSESYLKYCQINELLYALLSSLVFYKYRVECQLNTDTRNFNIVERGYTDGEFYLISLITNTILNIFRSNKIGKFNIHIYGILKTIFKIRLKGIENDDDMTLFDAVANKKEQIQFILYMVMVVMRLNNKFFDIVKKQDDEVKLSREIEKYRSETTTYLLKLLSKSDEAYSLCPEKWLYNLITYTRNEIWIYLTNELPSSCELFIEVLQTTFEVLIGKSEYKKEFGWSYLDLIYSLKLVILTCRRGIDNYKVNGVVSPQIEKLSKGVVNSIMKFRDCCGILMTKGDESGAFQQHDLIKLMFMMLMVCFLKFFKELLNEYFYDFSIGLLLEYRDYIDELKEVVVSGINDRQIQYAMDEFVNININDFVIAIDNPSLLKLQYFKKETIISNLAYLTSLEISSKSIINLFSVTAPDYVMLDNQNNLYYFGRLLKLLALNNFKNEALGENLNELENIYFICVKIYSTYSVNILLDESSPNGLNIYKKRSYPNVEEICNNVNKISSFLFVKQTNDNAKAVNIFESSFVSFAISYFSMISANKLIELIETHNKTIYNLNDFNDANKKDLFKITEINRRLFCIVIIAVLYEYGKTGVSNLIMERIYHHVESLATISLNNAIEMSKYNKDKLYDKELTWFVNCRFVLEIIEKSIDTWSIQRGQVNLRIFDSWIKLLKIMISLFEFMPINGDIKVVNNTSLWSHSIEKTIKSLLDGFMNEYERIVKIESSLSYDLPSKPLAVKVGSLVIMNNIWENHGLDLRPSIKNVMPVVGELVDDENDVVRRLAERLGEKINKNLYQN